MFIKKHFMQKLYFCIFLLEGFCFKKSNSKKYIDKQIKWKYNETKL